MKKVQEIAKNIADGAKDGAVAGTFLGVFNDVIPEKKIKSNSLFRAVKPPEYGKSGSYFYALGLSAAFGVAIGAIVGLGRGLFGKDKENEPALNEKQINTSPHSVAPEATAAQSNFHAESQRPGQVAFDSGEHTRPNHTTTIQPRSNASYAATIASERSAEKPAEMGR